MRAPLPVVGLLLLCTLTVSGETPSRVDALEKRNAELERKNEELLATIRELQGGERRLGPGSPSSTPSPTMSLSPTSAPSPTPTSPTAPPTPAPTIVPTVTPAPTVTNAPTTVEYKQNEILKELYKKTSGESWSNNRNWMSGVDPCSNNWYGVACSSDDQVTEIVIYLKRMSGYLPESLGSLTSLTKIDFAWNSFTGTVPTTFGKLTALKHLELESNTFSGTIPSQLGALSVLTALSLSTNVSVLTTPLSDESHPFRVRYPQEFCSNIPSEVSALSTSVNVFKVSGGNDIGKASPYELRTSHSGSLRLTPWRCGRAQEPLAA